MIKGFLNFPWFAWAVLTLVVALIYSFIWIPKGTNEAVGFRFFILRWGHALTWFLLTVNFVLRGISPNLNGIANLVAATGGVMYLLFITMTFIVK